MCLTFVLEKVDSWVIMCNNVREVSEVLLVVHQPQMS